MWNRSVYVILTGIIIHLNSCESQVLQFGACVDTIPVQFFSLEKFLGTWYVIERIPTWYEDHGHCAYKRIDACGRRVEIEHGFVRDGIQFVLHVNTSYAPGDDAVFSFEENNIDPVGTPLTVVATDYNNYAVVYGCKSKEELDIKYISGWILSRQTILAPEILEIAHAKLNSLPFVSTVYLERVIQNEDKCKYHWTAHVQAVSTNEVEDEDE